MTEEVSMINADLLAVENFSYTLMLGGACQGLGTETCCTTDKYHVLWSVQGPWECWVLKEPPRLVRLISHSKYRSSQRVNKQGVL